MKNFSNVSILIILFFSFSLTAQEKLKGNKEVTTENRNISEFTAIEVIDNLEVLLVYNENQSVNVEADSNLQPAVLTEVVNGVLTIKTDARIVSKKVLTVHVNVNKNVKEINAYNNAEVTSNNSLIIDFLTVNAFDNADFNLKLISKSAHINAKKTSDLKIELLSDETLIIAEGSSSIKATIDTKNMDINLYDKASFNLNGSTNSLEVISYSDSSFKGKDFMAKNAIVNASNNSNAYVNATESLEILAKNSSEVYVFSNPKITVTEFFDKATIYKKEQDKKLF